MVAVGAIVALVVVTTPRPLVSFLRRVGRAALHAGRALAWAGRGAARLIRARPEPTSEVLTHAEVVDEPPAAKGGRKRKAAEAEAAYEETPLPERVFEPVGASPPQPKVHGRAAKAPKDPTGDSAGGAASTAESPLAADAFDRCRRFFRCLEYGERFRCYYVWDLDGPRDRRHGRCHRLNPREVRDGCWRGVSFSSTRRSRAGAKARSSCRQFVDS